MKTFCTEVNNFMMAGAAILAAGGLIDVVNKLFIKIKHAFFQGGRRPETT